jgi:hypothetical protein
VSDSADPLQHYLTCRIHTIGCVIYCDGTSISNQNHEARFVGMKVNGENVQRLMGVHKSALHTSQAQFNGFEGDFARFVNLLKDSPLAELFTLDVEEIARKLCGMVTDHAADQKLLAKLFVDWKYRLDRGKRGQDAADELTVEERMGWAAEALNHAAVKAGPGWESLSSAQQDVLFMLSWKAMLICAGNKEYAKLTEEEQLELDLFLWHGCMMHKDLNAVCGGDVAMKAAWKDNDLKPCPIPLMNKFEKAASAQSLGPNVEKPAEEKHARGGTKLTCLAGALFIPKQVC